MNKRNFRRLDSTEVRTGLAVWLNGKSFVDTDPLEPGLDAITGFQWERTPVCGPFLVERVLFGGGHIQEPRIDLIDPATGDRRSMMCSWLLVPKEE